MPVLVVFVGPAVIAVLLVNVLGLEEYIPTQLDLPRFRPRQVLAISGVLGFILAALLGYELLIVGPDLRTDGVHNFWAAHLLDIEAFPVNVASQGDEGEVFGALLLGGARGAHVLYDPCHDEAIWVPVTKVELRAIDEVTCK